MLQRLVDTTETMSGITGETYSSAYDLNMACTLSVQSFVDDTTPAAEDFEQNDVNITNNTFPLPATAFVTGLKVTATSTGTLPAGITTATDYFIILVDADTVKVATTLENALDGVAINITDTGTADAVGTFTPTALADATISFQRTNIASTSDPTFASETAADWEDIDTATDISADGVVWFEKIGPEYRWFRIKGTLTAGSMNFTNYVLIRGEDKK